MKIPQSVRVLYEELKPRYEGLKAAVDRLVGMKKEARWHYESRVKGDESFALKMETGRIKDPMAPEDLFACTLVVENHSRIGSAEQLVTELFTLRTRRPKDSKKTHLAPYSFEFDDLRLFVEWRDDPSTPSSGLDGLLFEVQIRTFLQHAWVIATHDFVYKSDDVDWPSCRIAFQVKAMLENAELSIGEAQKLTTSAILDRIDYDSTDLRGVIQKIRERWAADRLPRDLRRLAQTICDLSKTLRIGIEDVWAAVDDATSIGAGANTLDLSPYAATLAALIAKKGSGLFEQLRHPRCKSCVFVPAEVELPELDADATAHIVRPPSFDRLRG
jgi:hypothetical protein